MVSGAWWEDRKSLSEAQQASGGTTASTLDAAHLSFRLSAAASGVDRLLLPHNSCCDDCDAAAEAAQAAVAAGLFSSCLPA